MIETRDDVRDVLAFLRGLVARPESLLAIKLRDTNDIVVIERGTGGEGDLVAVRLLPERRTTLGRLEDGRVLWQSPHPLAQPVRAEATQVLGRVLSVIHPAGSYV